MTRFFWIAIAIYLGLVANAWAGNAVSCVQAQLVQLGYDPGPVDGLFTAQTQAAVRAFQARYGLSISGLLDRQTRQELLPGLDQDEFDP